MPFISIFRDLKGKRGINEKLEQEGRQGHRNFNFTDGGSSSSSSSSYPLVEQSPWASLPPELLLDIIGRVEANEITWPARRAVVSCAGVCKSWREIAREVVRTPEECGLFTFPMSLKQVTYIFSISRCPIIICFYFICFF